MSRKTIREENGIKLPARVWRVVDRVRDGEKLCKCIRQKTTGETEVEFAYEPSARRVPAKTAQEAIKSGFLRPACDGLFGEDTSQTWTAP